MAIAYLLTAVAIVASHGKDYYLAPAVPSLVALGAVTIERVVASAFVRTAYTAVAVLAALPLLPLALPIVPPESLVAYERALHLTLQQQEKGDAGEAFPSTFADMLGWHAFAREVGSAYDAIPSDQRRVTSILVDNYGEAAALDLYGAPYKLPRAMTGQNQYFIWGPVPNAQSVNLLRVQLHPERLRPFCRSIRDMGITNARFARTFENGKSIEFCQGLHPLLSQIWPYEKLFI